MGVITVSVDDDVEKRFREKLEELGNGKGAMGDAISEALEKWIRENEDGKREWKRIMEKGLELGEEDFDREAANER